MSKRYYNPPQLRYLKARLSMFQKPLLWKSGVIILIISVVGWQYTSNPEFLARLKDDKDKSKVSDHKSLMSISLEDQSIAAEIDNIPVLLDDFQKAAFSSGAILSSAQPNLDKKDNFLPPRITENYGAEKKETNNQVNYQDMSNNTVKIANQFIIAADNLLRFSPQNRKTQFLGINYLHNVNQELGNITFNNPYQFLPVTLIVSNNNTVESANYSMITSSNLNKINNTNNASNYNTSITNLSHKSFNSHNNVEYIKPIQSTINTQPTNVSPNTYKVINNHISLNASYSMYNNVISPHSSIPTVTHNSDNYNSYVVTPLNKVQQDKFANPSEIHQ